MSIVKKKLAPKLTPQYKEQQELLAVKVDSLANEMGIQWCLLDTEVKCQVQATLAQAVALDDLATRVSRLATHWPGVNQTVRAMHNALEKIAKEMERI
jgi:hypothetical protein